MDARGARPINRPEAHGAGLAGRVKLAIAKLEEPKFLARLANGHDFRVGGGIVGRGDAVRALGDDFAVLHDDRTERPTIPRAHVFNRELNRARHEGITHPVSISWN